MAQIRILKPECGSGVSFATPDLPVFSERLAEPGRPVSVSTMWARFSFRRVPDDKLASIAGDDDEPRYKFLEDEVAAYFGRVSEHVGPAQLELCVRSASKLGRLKSSVFIREQDVPGISVAISRNAPDPNGGPVMVVCQQNGSLHIIEPRLVQLVRGLLVLLPVLPRVAAFVELQGPVLQTRCAHVLGSALPFLGQAEFDRLGNGLAAVMSTYLDSGMFVYD